MKKLLLALAITSAPAIAEEEISTTAEITRAAVSAAEPAGRILHDVIREIVAGNNGMLSSKNMHTDEIEPSPQQKTRSTRKTMKECIKPENVIDDDVKECMEGLRLKKW